MLYAVVMRFISPAISALGMTGFVDALSLCDVALAFCTVDKAMCIMIFCMRPAIGIIPRCVPVRMTIRIQVLPYHSFAYSTFHDLVLSILIALHVVTIRRIILLRNIQHTSAT